LCEKIEHVVEKEKEKPKENEKKYDNMMSALIGRNPQAFLDLLYPGSRFSIIVINWPIPSGSQMR
jgi:hypothetical protein